MKTIFITGVAGFIGYHLANHLLKENYKIVGLDNLNNYYDKKLKLARIYELNKTSKEFKNPWNFIQGDLADKSLIFGTFKKYKPKIIINLAAQAGVRYSISNPYKYIESNILGFLNILEACRKFPVENLLYASSSSVYGGNTKIPFNENDSVDHPVSLYAASKKSNELMSHTYSHLFDIPSTGLRFFTVYGPWGRPDMAPILFTKAILNNQPIRIFNNGNLSRDFTYIDDVVEIIKRLLEKPAMPYKNFNKNLPLSSVSWSPYRIFNIGNSNRIPLLEFIKTLEQELGKKAIKEFTTMQKGDVKDTLSDSKNIYSIVNYKPSTELSEGIKLFINWYKKFYK